MDRPGADATSDGTPGIAGRARLTTRPPSGLSWSALSTVALAVAGLAYTATVSRLLEPTAFGLMAIAKLVVLFGQHFARMLLASALLQGPALSDDEVRAAAASRSRTPPPTSYCAVDVHHAVRSIGEMFDLIMIDTSVAAGLLHRPRCGQAGRRRGAGRPLHGNGKLYWNGGMRRHDR